jgi:hypothetical protein
MWVFHGRHMSPAFFYKDVNNTCTRYLKQFYYVIAMLESGWSKQTPFWKRPPPSIFLFKFSLYPVVMKKIVKDFHFSCWPSGMKGKVIWHNFGREPSRVYHNRWQIKEWLMFIGAIAWRLCRDTKCIWDQRIVLVVL